MLRNVFLKTLRDQRRPLLWWGIGLVVLAVFTVAFYPSIASAPGFDSILDEMPEALARTFLGEETLFASLAVSILSGLGAFLAFLIIAIIYPAGMGGGDVKFAPAR